MKRTLSKLFISLVSISFFLTAFLLFSYTLPYKDDEGVILIFSVQKVVSLQAICSIIILIGYLTAMLLPDKDAGAKSHKIIFPIWIIIFILSLPFAVIQFLFGSNEIEPILVFLRDNQLDDMVFIGSDGFAHSFILWALFAIVLFTSSVFMVRRKKHFEKILLALSLILFVVSPLVKYGISTTIPNQAQLAFNIPERLQPPRISSKPETQKNLVIVYLESLERSYGQIPEIKPFYKPIQALADQGTELTNIIQTAGTNYTIAGIIATQCGIPLFSNGLKTIFFRNGVEASMENFLPNIHCLGDQLQDDGYLLSYMNGASLDKFSKRSFLLEHGYTRLLDKANVSDEKKAGQTNIWGLDDALLFELATKEFDTLVSKNQPFVQSMLTTSTHGPDAFLDHDCAPTPDAVSQMPRAIECTGFLVTNFIEHIRNSPVGDDTIVVVLSDHLSFTNTVNAGLQSVGKDRRNFFTLLDQTGAKTVDRHMAAFDIYPTLLETLGYTVEDGRANFGISLSSPLQNLTEELGVPTLNKIFSGNAKLSAYLWR